MFNDKRSGKIALITHCILNQNSRASGLAQKPSIVSEIVDFLVRNKIGIIQMPCPELAYAGVLRQPQTIEQYDNAEYRRHCRKIAEEISNQIQQYENHGIKLETVIGINGSPTCSADNYGIFMKELRFALDKKRISAPFYDIHYKSLKKDITKLNKLIK